MTDAAGAVTDWSLGDILLAHRDRSARLYAVRGDLSAVGVTTAELLGRSRDLAAGLVRDGRARGAVVLALTDPLEFAVAFFGVTLAGGVPVPAPGRLDVDAGHRRRVSAMVRSCRAPLVVTSGEQADAVREAAAGAAVAVLADVEMPGGGEGVSVPPRGHDDPAYVQYTSGSISDPKPVVVRNRHVRAQLRQAAAAFEETPDCVCVNWVPLHHDMGLVTSLLRPLWSGYDSYLLDAVDFVRRPRAWLEAMTEFGATHTSAPDFGYALCVRKVTDTSGLDLRRLRVARSAGEMVRESTLRAFTERFVGAGFDPRAFTPSYGLTEATLTVTACPVPDPPRLVAVSRAALRGGTVADPRDGDDRTLLVSAGRPLDGTAVRILGDDGAPLEGDRRVGQVWIAGPQVVEGDGEDGGRCTGDLGFLADGELVLLGRSRDRFQVRGENYYSTEIEACVAAEEPRVRPGRVAVFGVPAYDDGEPGVVVLAERVRGADPAAAVDVGHAVRRLVRRRFGLTVTAVHWLPAGSIPITTSGKLRRELAREHYLGGDLTGPAAR